MLPNVAHAIDDTWDQEQLPARVQFNKDLLNPNTKIGGQLTKQGTALGTLAGLVYESGVGLDNGSGMLGLDAAARVQNALRGTQTDQAAKVNAYNNRVGAYVGEKGQLLYPGSGGTHEERDNIAKVFSPYHSPTAQADALESELSIEKNRSDQLQRQIDSQGIRNVKVVGPEQQKYIDRVNGSIKALRAQAGGSAPTVTNIRQVSP